MSSSGGPFDRRWIAHRGGGDAAPENTLAAFEVGFKAGFRAFEGDVRLSADGVLWLLHDDTLDRTTDARGAAAAWRWENLQLVDAGSWHSARFKGEPPASLDAVLDFAARHGVWLNLEIKPNPGQDEATGQALARRAAQWAAQHPQAPKPLLSSFSLPALRAARRTLTAAGSALPLAVLTEDDGAHALHAAHSVHAAAVHIAWQQASAAVVQAVHAAGLELRCYTVNDAARARQLLALGVDGVFTDRLDLPRAAAAPA
ncbi:glycerophosphodiester phosphodiesterase family protein [Thiomonas sp.]|uniref:glycerophosphodiester phosphodiesterase family protein n=1 Tax=Thiomonas sp. TaxID=2047785 RepID=UPI00261AC277|nr:glycerophosphodiester phosphodiesterase family protein [Thiomonas sp.]